MKSLLTCALVATTLALPSLASDVICKADQFNPSSPFRVRGYVLIHTEMYYIRITVKRRGSTYLSRLYIEPNIYLEKYAIFDTPFPLPEETRTPLKGDLSPYQLEDFLRELCGNEFVDRLPQKESANNLQQKSSAPRAATALLPSGQASQDFFVADLNGDGTPDLVQIGPSSLTVTLRNADSTVLSTATYPVGPSASSGLAADFNGDGKLDLAITNEGRTPTFGGATSGTVSILLGNGDGTFQAAVNYPVDGQPDSLAAADFNGDGKVDLAVVGYSLSPNAASVLLGAGDGTFGRAAAFNVGSGPYSIIAADFNNDGVPDLATANLVSKDVSVLLGKGNGTFQPVVNTASGTQKGYLGFVDLNRDGNMDLVIADLSSNTLVPMLGNGNGTFKPPVRYLAGTQPGSLGIIPLADGNTVLLTVDDVTGDVVVAFAFADGTLTTPQLSLVGKNPSAIAAGDLNGDGKPDVVVADPEAGNLYVLLNGAQGQLASPVAYPVGGSPNPQALAMADLNGDGKLDVVVANQSLGSIGVLLGAGDGTFRAAQNSPSGYRPTAIALADFNGDGKLDLAIAGFGAEPPNASDPGSVTVLLGKGDGTFQAPAGAGSFPSLHPFTIVAGDFNGDGKMDFAVGISNPANNTGNVSVFLGKGDGTFQAPASYSLGPPAAQLNFITTGDLNGDGKLDLVLLTTDVNFVDQISVMLGSGDGSFGQAVSSVTGFGPVNAVVTDLDGDGKPDLVVAHCCGDTDATYLLGNGDGTFQDEVHFLSGPSPSAIAVTDFNGDGKPDLAIAGQIKSGGGTVVTMLNALTIGPGVSSLSKP